MFSPTHNDKKKNLLLCSNSNLSEIKKKNMGSDSLVT